MRTPKHLSPSSLGLWVQDPAQFYLRYMSDSPPPKEPQNKHMAVGASFDAHVKAFLSERLFGPKEGMSLQEVFESQVEPHNRTKEMVEAGEYLFSKYKLLGSLDHLMATLGKSVGPPRLEMDVRGVIEGGKTGEVSGIPFRVKPDLFFINEHGAHVILDWKVNGWFSSSGKSPTPGYACLREDGQRPSPHVSARVEMRQGVLVNAAHGIEHADETWARQLTIGAWMCGCDVGDSFVGIVHQLVVRPTKRVRVAEHVGYVSKDFQKATHCLAKKLWETIHSEHFFKDLTLEESKARCALLDQRDAVDPTGIHAPLLGLGD